VRRGPFIALTRTAADVSNFSKDGEIYGCRFVNPSQGRARSDASRMMLRSGETLALRNRGTMNARRIFRRSGRRFAAKDIRHSMHLEHIPIPPEQDVL
jgi:hypothetical protein